MSRVSTGLRTVFRTPRGIRVLARDSLATFGVVGGLLQVYDILTPNASYQPALVVALLAVLPLTVGISRAWPRRRLSRHLGWPDVTVTITVGDLFDQGAHVVVGYTDTFDTDLDDRRIIHPRSVQAQFQRRFFPDTAELDAALGDALGPAAETAETKAAGKTGRYPVGSVAVLERDRRLFFCLAYAAMGDDMIARSTPDVIWTSLSALWEAIFLHGRREPVAIAVIGSELAKVDTLDRANLIRLIILSFVSRSRTTTISHELIITIHPNDADKIDMLEMAAFLSTI